jgi:uncharacterized protein YndB with AHSA1/START domain
MATGISSKSEITINAPVEKVWQGLIDPAMVKQYLFGTDMKTTWEIGSEITYSGMWDGKAYEDRGTVLEFAPNDHIKTTYWSAAFGENIPENQRVVTYAVEKVGDATKVTITQDNQKDEKEKEHPANNWNMVLQGMKKLLET